MTGYTLPGTIITDNTQGVTVQTTSSQRKPCFIGLASPYVAVSKEAVTKSPGLSDSLAYSSNGIYKITAVGSSSGMNNFRSGVHWKLVDDKIEWLPKTENIETATITSITTPLSYKVSINAPVAGSNASSGYCIVSTSPNTIVGTAVAGIPAGTYQLCITVNGTSTQTRSIVLTAGLTWTDIIGKINTAYSGVGVVASIEAGAFKFTSGSTGVSSTVVVSDGGTNGILAAISEIGTYAASINAASDGSDSTSAYQKISYANTISSTALHGLSSGTYYINVRIDAGSAADHPISVVSGGYYSDIISEINSVSGLSASIVNGAIVVSSNTKGITSNVVIAEYSTPESDIFNALAEALGTKTISATTAGSASTIGYQTISSSTTAIVSSSMTRIHAGSYSIQIAANGAANATTYVVALSGTETWGDVVSILSSSVISVATVSLTGNAITFTSKISGASSKISIIDGSVSGLIAAINTVTGLYVTSTPVSTPGSNATAGYAELSSTPETFDSDKYCNLDSGVYHLQVSLNGAAASTIDLQVANKTDTWNKVISTISVSGMIASVVNGKIRITSNTTGSTSSVVISDGATQASALINCLNTLTAASITVKVPALSYERDKGEATITFTDGSNSHSFTIDSDIADAQTSLTLYGSIASLKALTSGSTLALSSVGSWVASGAKYYVSYQYIRPDSDYGVYKEFTDFAAVKADLGADVAGNTLVNLCNLALNSYGVPVVAVVQIKNATKASFLAAMTAIKYKDVQTVLPISSDADVRSYAITHVTERSLPANKRRRMTYVGAAAGTPIGDEETSNSLCAIASTIKNKRVVFVNATRGLYYYTDEDGNQQSTIVDGGFIAAAVGAFRDSFSDPTTTLMNRSIPGIDLLDADYDTYYDERWLTKAGASSCFLLAPSSAGGMKVIDDLTTDNGTVEKNNINIVTTEDYVANDVTIQMNKFHGKLIQDQSAYIDMINKFMIKLFAEYKRNQLISSVGYTKAAISPTRRDTVLISYGYYSVYTHKYTEGTYELLA